MYVTTDEPGSWIPVYADAFAPVVPVDPDRNSKLLGALGALGLIGLFLYALSEQEPSRRRRSRAYNAAPVHDEDKEYVSVRDGWCCTYCGRQVSRRTRHIDHSVSRANGGTNHLNNLRLACATCNLSKGPLTARQFLAY